MVRIFQIYIEKDHRKTPHKFSSFGIGSLQPCYADLSCISLYFIFLFFPIFFKLLPLCTSEPYWSQRSNRLKTCVQVKWVHLWPHTIPSWEHLICPNQKYFYFNGMLFAWGKLCGSPSDVFSFYHFVEKCVNPFCFTSGIFLTQPWDFPLYLQHYPWLLYKKQNRELWNKMDQGGVLRTNVDPDCKGQIFLASWVYIPISGKSYIFQGWCYALCQSTEDMKIWLITLFWSLLMRWGKLCIRIKPWLQLLTFSLKLCDLTQGSQHFIAEHNAEDTTI